MVSARFSAWRSVVWPVVRHTRRPFTIIRT